MTDRTLAFILALLPGLVISALTAWLTVKLSVRQFRSQRWWEKKVEAYSQIMEHLTLLEFACAAWYDDAISVKTLSDERRKMLSEEHVRAEESVRKVAAAGSYIVSADAASALSELVKAFDKHVPGEHWLDEVGRQLQATRECIAKVRGLAKSDLKL